MVYSKTSLPARGLGSGGDFQELRNLGWASYTRRLVPVDGERRRATLNKALIPLACSTPPALDYSLGGRGELYLALTRGSASESVERVNR